MKLLLTIPLFLLALQAFAMNVSGKIVNDYMYSNKKQYAPGVFVPLLSWEDGNHEKCLLFKTPLKTRLGSLYIIPSKICDLKKLKKDHIYKSEVSDFNFERKDDSYVLSVNGKIEKIMFPMEGGLSFLQGEIAHVEQLKNGEVCRLMNPRCEFFSKDNCNQCESGIWTPTLNWKCARASQRVCGVTKCGHKNQQACLKRLHTAKDILNCDEAKALTYCRKGLQVICEGDGKVICR